jgi:cytochrome c oxidase assembly protein subunit 15
MSERSDPAGQDSVWPHRLALLTAVATLPLLFVGGLVTSKSAGLAVPDWPTTFGYNMFLYPWSKMVGGILYEHSHRLVASAVGVLTLMLALVLWFYERRRWLRWLGASALGFFILPGVLGGLRVVLVEGALAILHACLAQAFFALAASLALFTSDEWRERVPRLQRADAGRIRRLSALTTALIYLQAVFGAVVRHTGGGIEAHVLVALLVVFHVLLLAGRVLKVKPQVHKLARPAIVLCGLMALQLGLGFGSYLGKFAPSGGALAPAAVVLLTTSHVVVGAVMLVVSLVLTLRFYRWLEPPVKSGARDLFRSRFQHDL